MRALQRVRVHQLGAAGVPVQSVKKVRYEPGAIKLDNPLDFATAIAPGLFDRSGQLTPYRATAQLFDTLEVRTRVTPAVTISIAELEDPTPNPALAALSPAFIFRGPAGTLTVAPYGEVPDSTSGAVVGVALLVGGALVLGGGGAALGYFIGRDRGYAIRRRH